MQVRVSRHSTSLSLNHTWSRCTRGCRVDISHHFRLFWPNRHPTWDEFWSSPTWRNRKRKPPWKLDDRRSHWFWPKVPFDAICWLTLQSEKQCPTMDTWSWSSFRNQSELTELEANIQMYTLKRHRLDRKKQLCWCLHSKELHLQLQLEMSWARCRNLWNKLHQLISSCHPSSERVGRRSGKSLDRFELSSHLKCCSLHIRNMKDGY